MVMSSSSCLTGVSRPSGGCWRLNRDDVVGCRAAPRARTPASDGPAGSPEHARSRAHGAPSSCSSVSTPSAVTVQPSALDIADQRGHDRLIAEVLGETADEAAVDLDRAQRVLLQPRQRREAGAEVVEHDPDAVGLELAQRASGDRVGADQRGLGDLERQLSGRELGVGERLLDRLGKAGMGELARGHVDRRARSGARPRSEIRRIVSQLSRSTQAPIGTIDPVSSATGMNSAGDTGPSVGLFQRSSASTAAISPVSSSNTGWNAIASSPRVSASRSSRRERQAPTLVGAAAAAEERDAVAAGALGLVHRAVGLADRLAGVGAGAADQRDPDARGHDGRVDPGQRLGDRLEQAEPELGRLLLGCAISSATTMNSSPPKRPTKSVLRTAFERRSPTSRIISSARSWPSVSLSVLRPSRSTNRTATDDVGLDPDDRLIERLEDRGAVRQPAEAVVAGVVDQLLERAVALDRDPREPRAVLHQRQVLGQRPARARSVQRERAEHLARRRP